MANSVNELTLPIGLTLDRFIKKKQESFENASGELSQLLRDLALAAKVINREINRAGLIDILGSNDDAKNVQGETQQKLDIIANVRMIRALTNGGEVCGIVTEEDEEIIHTGNKNGKYVIALDPLDGSSNIDVNVSVGTIFSVYRRVSPIGTEAVLEDFLQGGRKQVCAGYVLYGSSTILVYTTGNGVNAFTYEYSLGEYFLSHANIKYPENGTIYSINEGYLNEIPVRYKEYVEFCRQKQFSARYIGSLVADFHRNMLKGGIYLYPSTNSNPDGKLRLLYECYPMAFIAQEAGGIAMDGIFSMLDVPILDIHQRNPFFVGSTIMMEDFLKYC